MSRRCSAALAVLVLLAAAAPAARAGTEEFSTFSVTQQEIDDESLLDHFLSRSARQWRDEWEHAALALRTSQGCITSGQWMIITDLKLRTSMGKRAWLGVVMRQSESDIATFNYLDFQFRYPTAIGTMGAMFRPMQDKARQDFALSWEGGADTTMYQAEAVFTIEDMFNNLWAFRQTKLGGLGEPYLRHPYEPALRLVTRHEGWRAEVAGKWLTPSVKQIVDLYSGQSLVQRELWGVQAGGSVEVYLGPVVIEARGANQQAREHDGTSGTAGSGLLSAAAGYQRQWSAEMAVRRNFTLARGATLEARYLYQGRTQYGDNGPPASYFNADDRMLNLDATMTLSPRFIARAGGLFDRIGVATAHQPAFTYGTRNESRAYLSLLARFGKVSVQGIEGIELDPEPYPVSFHHDKGFLQLQTTF